MATAIALCLLIGAMGKSAQIPLYTWLPDAMEGPTPVSALIHAATMVTAGVYMIVRNHAIYDLSPVAMSTVAWIGGATALFAATIGLVQNDIKRVLAYSTVSQLGYMFLAMGVGAFAAGIFHLFTHAFFKALLFLASGSVMHAMGNVIDMRKFGGLRKLMPVTHLTFLCGAAALAGLPLLSGFWSKDAILESLMEAAGRESRSPYRGVYWFVFGVALLTAGLTAFYTFRAYFLTFWGELRTPPEAGDHAHESPRVMLGPLVVLAVGAVFAGIAVEPFNHAFSGFLAKTPTILLANQQAIVPPYASKVPHFSGIIAGLSSIVALAGVGLAWRAYRDGKETVPAHWAGAYRLSREKLYVDEVYDAAVVKPAETRASAGWQFESFLVALGRLFIFWPRLLWAAMRPLQNGMVQF
ncbi:MAG: NADH-quinone oxidoreductase subunit L, partial [Dehalococcoidia bacterium]